MIGGTRERRASAFLLLLLLFSGCRRPAEQPPGPLPHAASAVEDEDVATRPPRAASAAHPVIWLGMDALDWELLDRLANEGRMPNWKRLTSEGYSADLASFAPILSPILWTTAATGVGPDLHRVLDFQEVDPKTGQKAPISGLSRGVPAVWNLASAAGHNIGIVGWWATHPAEEVRGFFVSDRASPILFEGLPLSGAAFPTSLEAGVAQTVSREGKVTDEDMARFLDQPAAEIGAARAAGGGMENKAVALARILAATRVSQRIARELYDREHPDLMLLYFEGTDEIGHVFAADTPPRLPCVSDADAARYGRTVETYFGVIDRILGQWMRRAREDGATLVVHSDHGFKWGADRLCGVASGNFATAAFWHRMTGVFAAWGSRVRPTSARGKVTLFDIAPTALALLGLPADRKMPGRVLTAAFADLRESPRADLFDSVEVRRLAAEKISAAQSSEYARKLLALGYLSPSETRPLAPPGGDRPGMTEGAWNNLGVYERETRRNFAAAQADFEKSLALSPDYYSAMFNLAVLARARGDVRASEDWLFRSLAALGSDPAPVVTGWAHEYEKAGKTAAARSVLERAARSYPDSEALARELALLRYRGHDCRGALGALARFEQTTREPRTLNDLALIETCLVDRDAVIRLLERSLALDPNQPEVARTLAAVRTAR
ncbi:MAG TPA: alkaline phosphatase family protein [Thermoanaerobaculia bacterium]|nr:alkaline phosphatase family protein [Thermoanaerobaculia bacterium]